MFVALVVGKSLCVLKIINIDLTRLNEQYRFIIHC